MRSAPSFIPWRRSPPRAAAPSGFPGSSRASPPSPDAPGWQLQTTSYFSRATTPSGLLTFARGAARVGGRTEVQAHHYLTPGYTFETPVLGAQFYVGATGSYGWMDTTAEAVISRRNGRNSETNVSEYASG